MASPPKTHNQPPADEEDKIALDFASRAASRGQAVLEIGRRAGKNISLDTTHGTFSAFGFLTGLSGGAIVAFTSSVIAGGIAAAIGAATFALGGSIVYRLTLGRGLEERRLARLGLVEEIELIEKLMKTTRNPKRLEVLNDQWGKLTRQIGEDRTLPFTPITIDGLAENQAAIPGPASQLDAMMLGGPKAP